MVDGMEKKIGNIIADLIKDGKAKAAAAQAAAAQAAAAPAAADTKTDATQDQVVDADKKDTLQPQQQCLALIPYTIVRSLASLDNIYETRLFGWVLAKAQSVLKLYNKDLSAINIEHALGLTRVTIPARLLLGEGDKNYTQVVKAFELADKRIDYTKDNTVYHLNIIAFPELRKDGRKSIVTFVIHQQMWHALLDFSKGYRLFSLQVFMSLSSKYAIIMYLLITQQSQPKNYGIAALRQLLGCDGQKAYDRGANFFARVLDPARTELKNKAPWYFEYSATKEGRQHKYIEVIVTPVLNKAFVLETNDVGRKATELRTRLDDEVTRYMIESFRIDGKAVETVEPIVMRIGTKEQQLAKLGEIRTRTLSTRVKNPAGYLIRTLQNMYK